MILRIICEFQEEDGGGLKNFISKKTNFGLVHIKLARGEEHKV